MKQTQETDARQVLHDIDEALPRLHKDDVQRLKKKRDRIWHAWEAGAITEDEAFDQLFTLYTEDTAIKRLFRNK